MPIKPGKNETQEQWMHRCVPEMINPAPGRPDKRPQDQAIAICLDIWSHRNDRAAVTEDLAMTVALARKTDVTKAASVNSAGHSYAATRIGAGAVNKSAGWSFSAEDGNALLGANGDDWANYGKHHLGIDSSAPADTKAHYKYPFAKGDTVYRSALTAIRQRAGQQGDDAVFAAAGSLLTMIDGPDKSIKQRAYSMLEIKTVSEDQRLIRGVATTPTPDRAGDIVEPLGVEFKNPIPLLWQHRTTEPVGSAVLGRPTKDGINFEARIPKVSEPGKLKDRLDEVWQSLKIGLVKGTSIGFRAIEANFMKDGGIRFVKSEIMELSLVTIPANAEATIDSIKAFAAKDSMTVPPCPDCKGTGKMGAERCPTCDGMGSMYHEPKTPPKEAVGATQPGATKQPAAPAAPPKRKTMTKPMTILEQISAFEAKRAATVARMEELMSKAADAATTLDDAESQEYDDAEAEIKQIDAHLKRLHALEQANREKAKPVSSVITPEASSESRSRVVTVKADVPPGTAFVRYCCALAGARGNRWEAIQRAKQWADQTPEVLKALEGDIPALMSDPIAFMQHKAAVGSGTTTDATWASPLIFFQVMADQFISLLRPATIIGRIPGLRMVPFNIQMPRATAGTSMGWVGENAPKPVSNMAFDTVTLRWAKAAGIVVLTDELVRFSNPAAEAIVRGDMIAAMAQFLDRQFVDPSVAAVTNVSPASITNGVTPVTATGTNQAAFVADAKTLLTSFLNANLSTVGGVWIMSQRQALAFSLMLNALGQPFYPNITVTGGTLLGYPVVASENIPSVGNSPADGTPIIFAVAPEIMLADDGQVVIDASNQASVNMDSTPDSPPSGTTTLVSLWQMNMTGLRAERWINWLKRRSTAVAYISNANYA